MSILCPSFEQAQILLKQNLGNHELQKHCEATRQKAIQIATLLPKTIQINQQILEIGALLHDIGRSRVHDITHAYIGGQILLEHKYPDSVVSIVEKHVLGGFSAEEAVLVGLPQHDFIPKTWEEKIVCVADKLGVFEWKGILTPQKWLPQVNVRFEKLTKKYGSAEPYQTSMDRAREFTEELVAIVTS